MNARIVVIAVLIGIVIGAVGTYFGRQLVDPYLPDAISDRGPGIEGPVVAKRMEGDRLLLTVAAQEGAILVTFRKKVAEIDLLVEESDTVALDIKTYRPFVEDPGLRAVRKQRPGEMRPIPRPLSPVIDSLTTRDMRP